MAEPLIDGFRATDQLCPAVGHRPLRPALPLLHGRADAFLPATKCSASRDRGLVDLLIARGVTQAEADGRRAAGAARHPRPRRAAGPRLGHGLEELTLTTNGTQLGARAERLFASGVRRVNVSLDSLDPDGSRTSPGAARSTRCWRGIAAAKAAGLRVKINMVALAASMKTRSSRCCAGARARDST